MSRRSLVCFASIGALCSSLFVYCLCKKSILIFILPIVPCGLFYYQCVNLYTLPPSSLLSINLSQEGLIIYLSSPLCTVQSSIYISIYCITTFRPIYIYTYICICICYPYNYLHICLSIYLSIYLLSINLSQCIHHLSINISWPHRLSGQPDIYGSSI